LALEDLDVRVLRLPFVYGDGDPHIAEVVPMMRTFPPTQQMSIGHHVDVAQAVMCVLDAPAPTHRIYNVVDDEAPTFAQLFATVGAPPSHAQPGSIAKASRPLFQLIETAQPANANTPPRSGTSEAPLAGRDAPPAEVGDLPRVMPGHQNQTRSPAATSPVLKRHQPPRAR